MNKRHSGLLSWALGLLIIGLMANDVWAADKWTGVRSKNLNLVGNATEAQIRAVAVELEQFRESFHAFFRTSSKAATAPINVVVFKNEGAPQTLAGNFQRAEDVNYIALIAGAPIPRVVFHHYVHELTRDIPSTVPTWFTEGLAEFYGAIDILARDKRYELGQSIAEHVDVLKKSPFVTLEDLFAFDRASPQYNERERKGVYYAQSWALVNYLIVGMNGSRQPQISEFFSLVSQGKPAAESFQSAFKVDSKTLLNELETYVKEKSSLPERSSALKEKSEIDRDIKARTLSEAEAEFNLGDLFLHMNRVNEAETRFLHATALDPKLASAQAGLGMVRFRQDKSEEAIQFLKKSIELDPKNYLFQYYYAFVLDKNSASVLDELDAKREALGKAIELMPQFSPAYELLAYINLTADMDYNGTLELLQSANKTSPGNLNLRFLMAQAYVKKEELDNASKVLETLVRNSAADTPIREGARNLVNYIARIRETDNKRRDADEASARREEEAARAANRAREARAREAEASKAQAPVNEPAKQPLNEPGVDAPGVKTGELILVTPQKARPQGTKVTGLLTLMDCRNGVTITLKTPAGNILLHSDTPPKIEFVSFNPSVNASISCGPSPGSGIPVIITYRPAPGGPFLGEPLEVEFVEK